ncbi:NOG1 family protein [Sulfuracidifex metallicus]|uniref:GTP-binding protein n=1 Tax=Sulfuracidifex metallicus DSM 6482 = JCM 9184 TaxID=523847 RepID=A0A6A9QLV5_SULME|nr:GTPase [Sulfuracidifex metallicus]MUN28171.1 GTP-binding protein [Sulfuracidifex metallicus DSM 6482 = JCM 9184]WOE51294.1 50S ribosome-binding GTPase [Sulfuracidifex metallicus DSM 6482 = JCM 9184]
MLTPFERVPVPPEVDDVIEIVLNRLPKIGGKTVKEREINRLLTYINQVEKYSTFVNKFPRIEKLHPFYRESIEILADIDRIKICLFNTKRTADLAMRALREGIQKIKSSDEDQANEIMRKTFGRTSSILRKNRECTSFLIKVIVQLKKMMTVDPKLPTVIVAGSPNVGKSTLISRITRAKPEIANYPFTTKDIHVGHIREGDALIQFIDTPGILDRPNSERNQIELKSINALRNLSGITVFMFDVSPFSYYGVDDQFSLYKEVRSLSGKKVIPVINKIDEKDETYYQSLMKLINNAVEISAEKGIGLEELKREILKALGIPLNRGLLDN